MLISFEETGKNGLEPGEERMDDASVATLFFTKTSQCAVALS